MDIKRNVKAALKQLGFETLRKDQKKPVNAILDGNDTLVVAKTSFGKSAIYQTAGLVHPDKTTLVIEPTLSLLYAQVQELQQKGISADYIDSSRKKKDIKSILKKLQNGKLTFLYITPERLQNNDFLDAVQQASLYMVVIDECHCITEWGYTFREAYLKIGDFVDLLPDRPVLCACSATILEDRTKDIFQALHMKNAAFFRNDLRRKNLILLKKDVTTEHKSLEKRLEYRLKLLHKTIQKYRSEGSVIIYALTTGYVDAIYNYLNGIYPDQVARYHSKIASDKLKYQMEMDFLQGKRKIIVATSAFGMGIDVPDVECVIHFNTPISMTDYIQQIGRAGRDGRTAHCVLFYDENSDDRKIFNSFYKKEKMKSKQAAAVLKENYNLMQKFVSSTECMVTDILHFQGQKVSKSCKKCTNCARNRRGENR